MYYTPPHSPSKTPTTIRYELPYADVRNVQERGASCLRVEARVKADMGRIQGPLPTFSRGNVTIELLASILGNRSISFQKFGPRFRKFDVFLHHLKRRRNRSMVSLSSRSRRISSQQDIERGTRVHFTSSVSM